MTEGWGGAPFGLSIVVPAVAGPLNLGNVVVPAKVFVDRRSAMLRIESASMPSILQGIPLQIRSVNVQIDRDGFMLNPTSCRVKQIGATVHGVSGQTAEVASRFRANDCARLRYKPRMSFRAGARGRTRKGARVPFTAVLRQPAGQAHNRSVTVTLPRSISAKLEIVRRACTQAEYKAGDCERARVGEASVVTPILRDPLRGSVYFVRADGRRLPNLVVALRGQVDIDLVGHVSISRRLQLRTSFQGIPDIPVSQFRLSLTGGANAPVTAARNLCTAAARRERGRLGMRGQNGITVRTEPRVRIVGCARR